MTFRFLAPAEAELLEAIAYYAAIRADLGVRFKEAVSSAVRDAVTRPKHGAPRSGNMRRWLVKGFPYSLIYRASEDEVVIVAVAHQRRRPEYWAQRGDQ